MALEGTDNSIQGNSDIPVKSANKPKDLSSERLDGVESNVNAKKSVRKISHGLSSDSPLRQQKLKAWQPILTAGTVVPSFFIVGLIFLPLGIALYVSSDGIFEQVHTYHDCLKDGNGKPCRDVINSSDPFSQCTCLLSVDIPKDIPGPVYFYYGLSNYYQNHRRYVKSRNDYQLLGDLTQTEGCEPFDKDKENTKIAPCGAIANSIFTDEFEIVRKNTKEKVKMTSDNVAWPTDRKNKFNNPKDMNDFSKYAKPKDWIKPANELDPKNPGNNGFENTDLIVWMRTAALPTFRKLYRILNDTKLMSGSYTLNITFRYPVQKFDGEKRFIISTASWVGGKNSFLGVAYIVVGSLCVLMAIMFLFIHLKFGRSLTEMSQVAGSTSARP